jgi:hypothetical protein
MFFWWGGKKLKNNLLILLNTFDWFLKIDFFFLAEKETHAIVRGLFNYNFVGCHCFWM